MTTLGAPLGGRRGSMAGNSALRASSAILPLEGISGIGNISRPVISGFCAILFSPENRVRCTFLSALHLFLITFGVQNARENSSKMSKIFYLLFVAIYFVMFSRSFSLLQD
jgi:hypothetical protein